MPLTSATGGFNPVTQRESRIMATPETNLPSCPLPFSEYPRVTLAHGGGGRLMKDLIDGLLIATFDNAILRERHDAAASVLPAGRAAFTTDSYDVHPLFFPGGIRTAGPSR